MPFVKSESDISPEDVKRNTYKYIKPITADNVADKSLQKETAKRIRRKVLKHLFGRIRPDVVNEKQHTENTDLFLQDVVIGPKL